MGSGRKNGGERDWRGLPDFTALGRGAVAASVTSSRVRSIADRLGRWVSSDPRLSVSPKSSFRRNLLQARPVGFEPTTFGFEGDHLSQEYVQEPPELTPAYV